MSGSLYLKIFSLLLFLFSFSKAHIYYFPPSIISLNLNVLLYFIHTFFN